MPRTQGEAAAPEPPEVKPGSLLGQMMLIANAPKP